MLGGRAPSHRRVDWEQLIEIARSHQLAPALSWCSRQDATVPSELRGYLDAVLRLNGKRNERMCNQLEHVVGALNLVGIEPILLKGAAHVVGGLYPDPAVRLMADLDVLVLRERAQDAVAAMARIGFVVDAPMPEAHHHLPTMRHRETNIVIELHTGLANADHDQSVPVSWVHEQSRPVAFRGLRVKLPTPTILVGHNVVHDQLVHVHYDWKQIELRQLLDLALLRARHEQEIDWAELGRRFDRSGQGQVLATYLRYDEALFGQRAPAVAAAPRAWAVGRLRWSIEFPLAGRRLRMLAPMPMYYIRERLRDPRGLIRIFKPSTWTRRFRAVRRQWKDFG